MQTSGVAPAHPKYLALHTGRYRDALAIDCLLALLLSWPNNSVRWAKLCRMPQSAELVVGPFIVK